MNEELEVMGKLLRTQENRATADPIFMVEEARRVMAVDPAYHEQGSVWVCVEDHDYVYDSLKELKEWLEEEAEDEAFGLEVDDFEEIHYAMYWQAVQPFFTEKAAEQYIRQNRHHFEHGVRIFAYSAYRNYEWQAVREMLMEETKDGR